MAVSGGCFFCTYVNRMRDSYICEQLFVCFTNPAQGMARSKQSFCHWIVEAISLAYDRKGQVLHISVCAHVTRGVAAS